MPNPSRYGAWRYLHLSTATPIMSELGLVNLTASGRAALSAQMDAMQRRRLPPRLAPWCEGPSGKRIGSVGHLECLESLSSETWEPAAVATGADTAHPCQVKQLPWASVVGKPLFPSVCSGPRSTVSYIEHLAALCSGIPNQLTHGGLLTLSGDVVPLADLGQLNFPNQGLGW